MCKEKISGKNSDKYNKVKLREKGKQQQNTFLHNLDEKKNFIT